MRIAVIFLISTILLGLSSYIRAQDPSRQMEVLQSQAAALSERAKACGSDQGCLKLVQEEMQAMIETAWPKALHVDSAQVDICENSSDPCCYTEQEKQSIRANYGKEPSWIQCAPVTLELKWDVYEESSTSMVKYTMRQEFPGSLELDYDQLDKAKLLGFHITGPRPRQGAYSNSIQSIQGAFTVGRRRAKSRLANDPEDYLPGRGFSVSFDWHLGSNVTTASGGMWGPWPKEHICVEPCLEYACSFGRITFSGEGDEAISGEELRLGRRQGEIVRKYAFEFPPPWLPTDGEWVRKGNVTVRVKFSPVGGLEVSPAEAFRSAGPNLEDSFEPAAKTYRLTNRSDAAIDYAISNEANWVDVSPVSGSIAPGESVAVRVTISSEALKLPSGAHRDLIAFINLSNGKGNTERTVELSVEQEQTWEMKVEGWERTEMKWGGLELVDRDEGTKTRIVKAVKFDWNLTAKFKIRKERGQWVYQKGAVTRAELTPTAVFSPPGLYDCTLKHCSGKAKIDSYSGHQVFGGVSEGTVHLRWPPFNPAACVSCRALHSDLPKTPYEAQFESFDFITQISLDSYPLLNKTFPPKKKREWIYYVVTLRRLD